MSDSSTNQEPETTPDVQNADDTTAKAIATAEVDAQTANVASDTSIVDASAAAGVDSDSESGESVSESPIATPAPEAAPAPETAEASSPDAPPTDGSQAEAPSAPVVATAGPVDTAASEGAGVETSAQGAKGEEAKGEEAPTEAASTKEVKGGAVAKAESAEPQDGEPQDGEPQKAKVAAASETGGEQPAGDGPSGAADPALDPVLAPLVVAMEAKAPIEGKVIGWNKGGYHVALGQIAAFCPVSQIETGSPRAPKRYVDRTFKFVVIDVAKDGRRVVVSRAGALKSERKDRAAKVRETIKTGAVLDGTVRSLTDFGAFVRIADGIEGLVHVSELSRRRIENPKELLTVGQKVKVKVLKVEKGGERISLSMKRLESDPWKTLNDRLPAGSPFTGTIRRKTEFGLFVEVEPGIEGLVHTSRLPHGKSLEDESLAEGKTVEGWVQETEPKRRRLGLSLRPVPNAKVWDAVEERFPIGTVVKATVERVADFGAFIELEPGLTGLLPFSELRGDGGGGSGGVNFKRQYHAGKQVSVKVLSIEVGRKRISLGTETSKAVGTDADYRDFKKQTRKATTTGLGAMASAFAKLQGNG
jgi:small subunit ribosomal protein S1